MDNLKKHQYSIQNLTRHETIYVLPKHPILHDLSTYLRPATLKYSSYPVPIFSINFNKRYLDFDPIATRVEEKNAFNRKKLKRVLLVQKQIPKFPDNAVTSDFMDYVEMKLNDPDPTSNSKLTYFFDWRHHGGNLSHQRLANELYLVQSSFSDSDELPLRLVKVDGFNSVVGNWSEDYLRDNYVFEIVKHSSTYALRKRKSVEVVTITEIDKPLKFTWKQDIAACLLTSDDLYTIDQNGQFDRRNILTEMALPVAKLELSSEYPMMTMKQYETDTFTISDAKRLFMFDMRNGEETKKLFNHSNVSMKCEEIFAQEKSLENKHLIFIAASHIIYLIDVRKPGQPPIMQVTHQLFRPPMMMRLALVDNDVEIVCVASNHPNDVKMFSFSHNDGTVDLLPLSPMSLERPLHEIRVKGKLLLADYLTERINMSTAGIDLITNRRKGTLKLFVQTSIGDIFKTEVYTKQRVPDKSLCNFENEFTTWDDALRLDERLAENLQYTQVVNLKGLTRVFLNLKVSQKEKNKANQNQEDVSNFRKMHEKKVPEWKITMKKAKRHNDILAPHILDPWEVDEELDEENNGFTVNDDLERQREMRPEEKVSTWLTSHHVDDEHPPSTIKDEVLSEEFMEIDKDANTTQPDFSFTDAIECNDTVSLSASMSTTQKSATGTAKKRKRIKGFC